jgi:hypothetical protein
VKIEETELTPELAARLLANQHPNQRRPSTLVVSTYARAIKEGRWRLIADPILVDQDGRMFNGAHRCSAVIAANRSIPVMICWDADASTFDLIDIGRKRSAYQFITEGEASLRASAARVTLWYRNRFDRPLQPRHIGFDVHEIMVEVEAESTAFDAMIKAAKTTYEYTGLVSSVVLGAYAIAFGMGYVAEVEAFVDGIVNPNGLPAGDPARALSDRFRKQDHRGRRRELVQDWSILVRALNLHLEGRKVNRLVLSEFWPRVAELEADFNRRRSAWTANRGRDNDIHRSHGQKAS